MIRVWAQGKGANLLSDAPSTNPNAPQRRHLGQPRQPYHLRAQARLQATRSASPVVSAGAKVTVAPRSPQRSFGVSAASRTAKGTWSDDKMSSKSRGARPWTATLPKCDLAGIRYGAPLITAMPWVLPVCAAATEWEIGRH